MENKTEKPAPDAFFDHQARPVSERAQTMCEEALLLLLWYEEEHSLRQRKRKARDEEILVAQLEGILANVCLAQFKRVPRSVAVSRSKQVLTAKGAPRVFNNKFPALLDTLAEMEMLQLVLGDYDKRRQSTIAPGPALVELLRGNKVSRSDFQVRETKPIVLRAAKTLEEKKKGKPGRELPLPDNEEARTLAAEVLAYNEFLAKQDIQYVGDRAEVDETDLATCRIFNNGSLRQGGRLFGGFWGPLSDEERQDEIVINGEHLVGLDFGQTAVHILYALAGQVFSGPDAYLLPGFERSREGVKTLLNVMINDDGRGKARRALFGDQTYLSPDKLTNAVKQAIEEVHAPIWQHIHGNFGPQILYQESQLLMNVLKALMDLDVPALSAHDCVYVRLSDQDAAEKVMKETSMKMFNMELPVHVGT